MDDIIRGSALPPDDDGPIADVVDVLGTHPGTPPPPGTTRTEMELPWRTVLRVLLTLGLLWFIYETKDVLMQIFLGFLLAAALFPLVWRLERRGMSRGAAVVAVLLSTIAVLALLVALVVPSLVEEAADFWNNLPTYARDSLSFLEKREPQLYTRIIRYVDEQTSDSAVPEIDVEQAISGGMTIFGILAGLIAAIAVAAFTLTTGDETLKSLGRGLPRGQEEKVRRLVPEVIRVVSGYIVGQMINSTLFALFTFALFTILDLPSPLVAAVIAFVLDAVPIVGATLATGIFAILALAQGTTEFLIIVVACLIYQQFENYVTSPRVFGRTLRISPFVSLIAVLIGSTLMGIPGVLLGPPVAALISAAFRVWGEDIESVTGPGSLRLSEIAEDSAEPPVNAPA
ncbi:MAG: AI-2E family transporter [Thermomicrobiales bacterium]|nr:AI-2E family transporter [Thermomicrobiales bacterium]